MYREFNLFILSTAILLSIPAQAGSFNCTLDGVTVGNLGSIKAYTAKTVAAGSSCAAPQARLCFFGNLTGSALYKYSSCSVSAPVTCSFNGQIIPNGGTVTAYSQSSVPASGPQNGITCNNYLVTRTCTNGVLSGSGYPSCVVDAPRACTFDGQSFASGTTTVGYVSRTVDYANGGTCMSGTMSCSDGSWTTYYGGAPLTSLSCTPVVPVLATVTPASQYKCTNRQVYSPTMIYDASFALQPETDVDCLNANNFFIARGPSTNLRQAIWNNSSVIANYMTLAPPQIQPSKCAYKLNADEGVTFASDRMDMYACRDFCVNASHANPAANVMCYFAHTPVEGFVNGVGSNSQWIPPAYTPYYGGGEGG